MGNCQAIDAATLVIQHPCGKVDKFYWPMSACEVMRMNPGHYVAQLISSTVYPTNTNEKCPDTNSTTTISTTATTATATTTTNNTVRVTKIKLLRPTDTLVLGQVYRLITTQEVMRGLRAKKSSKMKKNQPESAEKQERVKEKSSRVDAVSRRSQPEKEKQVIKQERYRPRTITSTNSAAPAKSRTWQPSLKSISEAAS